MEKIKSVCVMRDLVKAVAELQDTLQERLGISLNEAMVLCSIGDGTATAGEISRSTGFKAPQTSKVIRTVEGKRLIERQCGNEDHRRMEFTLSEDGRRLLLRLKTEEIPLPPVSPSPVLTAGMNPHKEAVTIHNVCP